MTQLYRELGYPDGKAFLEAYGYTYGKSPAGRLKTIDPEAVIKVLQERYPNGSPFKSAVELFEANPDYLPNLKTIINLSMEVFGMSFGKYLLSIGMIQPKSTPKAETKTIKKKSHVIRTGVHDVAAFCMEFQS